MAWPTKTGGFKVPDSFGTEVSQENRRLTGVTPRVTKAYQEKPARFLKKSSSLRALALARKV